MTATAPERTEHRDLYPTDDEFVALLKRRSRKSFLAQSGFLLALIIAVLALFTLLYTVINDAFGLVAIPIKLYSTNESSSFQLGLSG